MPGKHVAPRHRAPQTLRQQIGRLAGDVVGLVPGSGIARTAVAVGAAGLAVGVGVLTVEHSPATATASPRTHAAKVVDSTVMSQASALLKARQGLAADRPSRAVVRPPLLSVQRADKTATLPPSRQSLGGAVRTASVAPAPPPTPRGIAASLLGSYGWDSGQFSCLESLWTRESGWNPYAENSSSGAYGIPQALPGSKMASFGSDWATNATTQIKWGLWYIRASYGSPCGAWSHSESYGWY